MLSRAPISILVFVSYVACIHGFVFVGLVIPFPDELRNSKDLRSLGFCRVNRPRNAASPVALHSKQNAEDEERFVLYKSPYLGRFLPENDVVTYEAEMEALDKLEEKEDLALKKPLDIYERFDADPYEYELTSRGTSTLKWSRRSASARQRWADPSYRQAMIEKRAKTRAATAATTAAAPTAAVTPEPSAEPPTPIAPSTGANFSAGARRQRVTAAAAADDPDAAAAAVSERRRRRQLMREDQNRWLAERVAAAFPAREPGGAAAATEARRRELRARRSAGALLRAREREDRGRLLGALLELAGLAEFGPALSAVCIFARACASA
jgi:hypothetical protein